jgi:hypothetical protein
LVIYRPWDWIVCLGDWLGLGFAEYPRTIGECMPRLRYLPAGRREGVRGASWR